MRRGDACLCVLLLSAAGCDADLSVPTGAHIRCNGDNECPSGYACRQNACKSLSLNEPPAVTVGDVARALDVMQIPITVFDAEDDLVDVAVQVRATPDSGLQTIAVIGGEGLAATPAGTAAVLHWQTAAADLAALGQAGYASDLSLVLTPSDAGGPGAAVVIERVEFGNTAPDLKAVVVDDAVVSGKTVIRFLVADAAGDPVSIDRFEVSALGDFSDAVVVPTTSGPGGTFPGGAINGLATTSEGIWHNVTWDSLAGAELDASSAAVRLGLADDSGAQSLMVSSGTFEVDNDEVAPELSAVSVTDAGTVVVGPVSVAYSFTDSDNTPSVLFADYSLDGTTWLAARSESQVIGLLPNQPHSFVWDTGQLPRTFHPDVLLRLTIHDGTLADEEILGPYDVDATVAGADTSPPTYLYPPDGALFAGPDVVLQWTPRFGASEYCVQVGTSAAIEGSEIPGSPFCSSATVLALNLDDDLSYWWRVATDVSNVGVYSTLASGTYSVFHRLKDAIYVHCPQGAASCLGGVGNRGAPLGRIQTAIALAQSLGIYQVKIAARGGGEAYPGIIRPLSGVDLLGGYDADFNEGNRDPANPQKRARLSGGLGLLEGTVAIFAEGIEEPTLLEGLSLTTPDGPTVRGVRMIGCEGITLRESDILWNETGLPADVSIGIELTGSSVSLENTQVGARPATEEASAVVCDLGSLEIVGGELSAIAPATPTAAALKAIAPCTLSVSGTTVRSECSEDCVGIQALPGGTIDLQDIDLQVSSGFVATGVELDHELVPLAVTFTGGTIESVQTGPVLGAGVGIKFQGGSLSMDGLQIFAQGMGSGFGTLGDYAEGLVIANSRIEAGSGEYESIGLELVGRPGIDVMLDITRSAVLGGPVVASGIYNSVGVTLLVLGPGSYTVRESALLASTSTGGSRALWVRDSATLDAPVFVFEQNILIANEGAPSVGFFDGGQVPPLFTYNLIGAASLVAPFDSRCIQQENPGLVIGNLVTGCNGPLFYLLPEQFNLVCNGNFAQGTDCQNIVAELQVPIPWPSPTGNIHAPNPADVFAPGFDPLDYTTWTIAPQGPADLNGDGVWTAGEPGFDLALIGPP